MINFLAHRSASIRIRNGDSMFNQILIKQLIRTNFSDFLLNICEAYVNCLLLKFNVAINSGCRNK